MSLEGPGLRNLTDEVHDMIGWYFAGTLVPESALWIGTSGVSVSISCFLHLGALSRFRTFTIFCYFVLIFSCSSPSCRLLPSIVEHLNAEIVLMTVTDCGQAIDWLKCSYLYVRIKKVRYAFDPKYFIFCCQDT